MILTDIHCHILPGVDDGAIDAVEMMAMLRKEYRDGVRRIILTPHFRAGMFEPSMRRIEYRFKKVRDKAARIGQNGIELYLGCEYYRGSDMCRKLKAGVRPTMAGTSYVLVEFSSQDTYTHIRNTIYEMIVNGFIPIIAHIERYEVMVKDFDYVGDLIELGARIQVNADSVLGNNGHKIKRYCKKLMDKDCLHFIASDSHNLSDRAPNLGECAAYVEKKRGLDYAVRIFQENPDEILGRKLISR